MKMFIQQCPSKTYLLDLNNIVMSAIHLYTPHTVLVNSQILPQSYICLLLKESPEHYFVNIDVSISFKNWKQK